MHRTWLPGLRRNLSSKKKNMLCKWNHNTLEGEANEEHGHCREQQWGKGEHSPTAEHLLVQGGLCFRFPTPAAAQKGKKSHPAFAQNWDNTEYTCLCYLYIAFCYTFIHFSSCWAINLISNNYVNSSLSDSYKQTQYIKTNLKMSYCEYSRGGLILPSMYVCRCLWITCCFERDPLCYFTTICIVIIGYWLILGLRD